MHGRVKVRQSKEEEAKLKELKQTKSNEYALLTETIFTKRKTGEFSLYTLEKIAPLLEKSPDIFTLWNCRREILLFPKNCEISVEEKCKLFDNELNLTSKCLVKNPKSYASWHHRSWTILHHPEPNWQAEIDFCNLALKSDDRNFHCWDYRRFIVKNSKVPVTPEIDFTSSILENNFSNYSAWHYRQTLIGCKDSVCTAATPISPPPCFDFSENNEESNLPWIELDLAHNAFFTDPKDQGPWFYYWWLLGRGVNHSYLRELYLSRVLQRVFVVFTAPRMKVVVSCLQVDIKITHSVSNETSKFSPTDLGGWHSALDDVSAVWWFELPKEHTDLCSVSVTIYSEQTETACSNKSSCVNDSITLLVCKMEADQLESLTRVALDPRRLLNPIISPVNEPSSLLNELETIRELYSMEPNNKWVLLTLISFLRYIRPENATQQIKESINTLQTVHSQRKRYYQDMASAHVIEDALVDAYSTNSRNLNLSSTNLTRACCLDWCTLMTHLDLSNNRLEYLPQTFAYLVCLKNLNLDDNQITSLKPISELPLLLEISVCRNSIAYFDGLESVLLCPLLRQLNITGNKVTELANFTLLLAEHPGSKRSHNSLNVIYNKPVPT